MILLKIILFATFLHKNLYAQRRIVEGQAVSDTQKGYMVYLALAPQSPRKYDTWICGGAIIHPKYVLTSAACIEDVQNAYVVAGYNQYVKFSDFEKDKCTSKMKRKIISSAIPSAYTFTHESTNKWSTLDIAVVEVDKPFDYTDVDFKKLCSYLPKEIKVNFDKKYEQPSQHVMALGWGHMKKMRLHGDSTDFNVDKLRYATSIIFSKENCKKYFSTTDLGEIIDKYMICTYESSTYSEAGPTTEELDPPVSENIAQLLSHSTASGAERPVVKRGICQNDHGGPLVTWINDEEVLLGVASFFDINKQYECQQPNLFTSTALNKQLIDCALNKGGSPCTAVKKDNKVYEVIRRQFSWKESDQ